MKTSGRLLFYIERELLIYNYQFIDDRKVLNMKQIRGESPK